MNKFFSKCLYTVCLILFTQVLMSSHVFAAEEELKQIDWQTYGVKSFARAKQNSLPILLLVKADWCPHCQEMEAKTLHDESIIKYVTANFVPVRIDIDKDGDLAKKYQVKSLPTMIILGSDDKVIKTYVGFSDVTETMTRLSQGLKEYESQ